MRIINQFFMKCRKPFVVNICLFIILLLATSIRLLGIQYGLPYTFHTDEPTIVDRALRILRTGDYNPHF
jgi:4-amino-4-deoxy-L-arabinose transferase-like glycosyltransferase